MALFSSVISGPATRIIEGMIRDITQQVVRDHDLASRRDVDALRRALDDAERRIATLEAILDGQAEAPRAAEVVDPGAAEAVSVPPALVPPADPALVPPSDVSAAPTKSTRGRKSLRHLTCQIEDCDETHRSKGFCSAHYQQWRRGTLTGFVSAEGLIYDGPRRFQVNHRLSGKPCTVAGKVSQRVIRVAGETVEATALAAAS